jgi:putative Ca2+/H+ antiporter (TMEM165/GDT1 family)
MIPQAVSIAVGAALVAVVNYRILLIAMSVAFLLSAVQMVSRAEPDAEEAPGAALAPPTADVNKVIAKQN